MKKLAFSLLAMLFCVTATFAQSATIKGKVVDRNNQPVEGASVKEKGTGNGTSTDKDGNFTLKVSSKETTLIFSGVGLTEQEKNINGTYVEAAMLPSTVTMGSVEIVGTRSNRRSATETPVPVDIIPVSKITNTLGQADLNQILQYVAPSFNSNRQSGADGADHIDPASLRGLGPDQTLVLVNGKRWHQSSLVNIFGTRGRGNTGTDLNAIPASSIERIEILRDGAAAQYGSDAIAGVINIVLKSNVNQGSANVSVGEFITGRGNSLKDTATGKKIFGNRSDGLTIDANVNYGFALKDNGFINLTGEYITKQKTYRPNFPTPNPSADPRRKSGDGSLDNYSLYFNSAFPVSTRTNFYAFGGFNQRNSSSYAYTRYGNDSRNVSSIYPDGFDPLNHGSITDFGISFGLKSSVAGWKTDVNATLGLNKFKYDVTNTLNTSLGAASPTKFYSGGFQLSQNLAGAHFSKAFAKVARGANIALGAEVRQDQYKIFKGEIGSYKTYPNQSNLPGGAQGFPGFQPSDETNKQRTNVGAYVDAELDATKSVLLSGALRGEHYSDFGWTGNFKLATRIKIVDNLALRGSVSTGFRAPSLPQINFSNTYTNVAAGNIFEQVIAPNYSILAQKLGLPALKQETSVNGSVGFTTRPIRDLSVTVDGYAVTIKNRIVMAGPFSNTDPAIGDILTASNITSAQFFANSVDTRTKGLDLIAVYGKRIGAGRLTTTFAANFNDTKIKKVNTIDQLAGREADFFNDRERSLLIVSAPKSKMNLSFDYKINKFSTNLRFTHFSAVDFIDYTYVDLEHNRAKTTTDLSFSFAASQMVNITIGASNIFDVYPDNHPDPTLTETGTRWEAIQMGMGGSFFFGKIGVKF